MQILQTMPCRVKSYEATINGYNLTKTNLISFDDVCNGGGGMLMPAAYSDYIGSFLYIPILARLFDLGTNTATMIFFSVYGIFCILFSIAGLMKLYTNTKVKVYGCFIILFLGIFFIFISDTYSFYGLTSLALLTWWSKIYLLKKKNIFKYIVLCLVTGIIIGFANSVRGNSGTDVFISIFLLSMALIFVKQHYEKILSIFLILIPILILNFYLNELKKDSREYLINNTDIENLTIDLNFERAMWHNAYYSLGYLAQKDNKDVPEVSDSYSLWKAHQIDPTIVPYSKKYENLLKNEYFSFIKKHPLLFIKITASKFGVVLLYFIIFFNIGIYFFYKNKINLDLLIFFLPGILFNSLFGLVTEPNYTYLLGMFAYSGIYTVNLMDDYYMSKIKFKNSLLNS